METNQALGLSSPQGPALTGFETRYPMGNGSCHGDEWQGPMELNTSRMSLFEHHFGACLYVMKNSHGRHSGVNKLKPGTTAYDTIVE